MGVGAGLEIAGGRVIGLHGLRGDPRQTRVRRYRGVGLIEIGIEKGIAREAENRGAVGEEIDVLRAHVEARLMLGGTRFEAMQPVRREALRRALLPIINSMSATGVVSLPGMMTGQILGGVAPAEAVKYQILIMFLIAGGTGLGAVAAVLGGVFRLTDARHRLRLDHLAPARR